MSGIAKTVTSNGEQFTFTHEMLTAAACGQRWPHVVAGTSARFSKFTLVLFCFVLLYSKSFNEWSLGEQSILFPSTSSPVTSSFSENKIHSSPWDQSLSVKCSLRSSRFLSFSKRLQRDKNCERVQKIRSRGGGVTCPLSTSPQFLAHPRRALPFPASPMSKGKETAAAQAMFNVVQAV